MNSATPTPRRVLPSKDDAGFTLTEVVLAMAIIASALMAVLAVVPTGMDVSRSAMDRSVVATMLEDISQRLQGEKLEAGIPALSPAYFDEFGVYLPPDNFDSLNASKRVYRADVVIRDWKVSTNNTDNPLKNTSGIKSANIKLSWPLDDVGNPNGPKNPRVSVNYNITTLSGPDWKEIDDTYEPKIGL